MTDGIRNFMYTKHNRDITKLRIFSFIPQRQRIQPNFMNDSIRTLYQTIKHTNTTRTTKSTTSTWVSLLTQSLCSYNWDNANSGVFIFKIRTKLANFAHWSITNFVHCIIPKNMYSTCCAITYISFSSIFTGIRYHPFLYC